MERILGYYVPADYSIRWNESGFNHKELLDGI